MRSEPLRLKAFLADDAVCLLHSPHNQAKSMLLIPHPNNQATSHILF